MFTELFFLPQPLQAVKTYLGLLTRGLTRGIVACKVYPLKAPIHAISLRFLLYRAFDQPVLLTFVFGVMASSIRAAVDIAAVIRQKNEVAPGLYSHSLVFRHR